MQIINIERALGNTPKCGEIPGQKDILRQVMTVAWPSMLEMLLVSLVGLVDTAMVSSLGESAIAAVGITTQPKFIGLCFFMSLGMAVSALAARRKGEQNEASATQVLRMTLVIALVMSLVVSVLFVGFAKPICYLAGAGEDIVQASAEYLQIIMGGIVFTVVGNIINAVQRGCGNTQLSMKTNVASNLVNIVLNYLLIGGHFGFPALGIRGAAIATVIGTFVGCMMSIASLFSKHTYIHARKILTPSFGGWFDHRNLRSLVDVGGSAFVEQIFMRVGFLAFSLIVAKLGTLEMAAHVIGMNVMTISFCIGDGLQTASIALSGQNLGRNRPDMARIYASVCQRVGLACAVILSVVLFVFNQQIYYLFSADPVVLSYGSTIILLLCLILFFQISQVIYGGVLRSAGDTKYTAMVSLVSITIVRVSISWVLCYPMGMGLAGAWLGILFQQILTWYLFWKRFHKGAWTNIEI